MSQALCFQSVEFDVIQRNQLPWVRGYQIGTALGYGENADVSIRKLYTRHADEFTPAMTAVVTLPTEGGPQETRIFSLRGCHLLAMFARTPVAKQFRRWVLDVLDKLAEEERAKTEPVENPEQLSPAHRSELKGIVDAKLSTYPASVQGKARSEIWTRFNRHFRIAEYAQLPAERMAEARDYLIELEVKALKALPTATPALSPASEFAFRTEFPADMHTGRKDALKKIQSLMAGVGAARDVVRLFCHPGGKSMSMTLDEKEIYDALYQLYCAADDSLLAAYRALDAGYRIGRQYGRG